MTGVLVGSLMVLNLYATFRMFQSGLKMFQDGKPSSQQVVVFLGSGLVITVCFFAIRAITANSP